ncbi:hypothetical protein MJN51_41445, partial [Salmonella enterica subsp. enterica serovar Kentucky]|nr:hypothetical protein [Salmonella enterica subsp. enterica serovar Kentucky]
GRTAARALESVWAGNTLQYFFDRLMRNLKSGDTATANVTLWDADVPLAQGAATPLLRPLRDAAYVHGESGMEGYDFVDHQR